jgi:hypothetical protein
MRNAAGALQPERRSLSSQMRTFHTALASDASRLPAYATPKLRPDITLPILHRSAFSSLNHSGFDATITS